MSVSEAPFMTKKIYKEIMKRSRLRNIFLKDKTETNKNNHKSQRNYEKMTGNTLFWTSVKRRKN